MSLVIKNASLLLGSSLEYVNSGFIEIDKNGLIRTVGTGKCEVEYKYKSFRIIDAEGFLLIPGLINAHTHLGDSIGKDIAADAGLDARVHPTSGIKSKILEKSSPEHIRPLIRSSALSMLRKGITAFADFREGGINGIALLKDAISDLPIKCLILGRIEYYFELPKKKGTVPEKNNQARTNGTIPDNLLGTIPGILKISHGIGISGANENTDASLRQYHNIVRDCSRNLDHNNNRKGFLVGVHAAESSNTLEFSRLKTGKTEVYRIMKYLKPDFVVHMTYATDQDISMVAKKRIGVIVCPRANGVLGCGIPRVAKMLRNGCTVAIGTDNIMLNSPDIFREMDYIWKASRSIERDILSARDILKMSTVNASKILGLNSGCIKSGRFADILFLDKSEIDLYPLHNPYVSIVHRADQSSIKAVMIDGLFVEGSEL